MTRIECARAWQIDALREGRLGSQDAESFERHRRACATCAARVVADARLGELGRASPRDGPTELELRRLRARVMRDAVVTDVGEKKHVLSYAAVLALALTVISFAVWIVARHGTARVRLAASTTAPIPSAAVGGQDEPFAGSVVPASDSAWTQTRVARVERVHLDAGTLMIHVRPQQSGERFLVGLPDGEIEVRGTTFAVTVSGGATTRVRVDEGTVELRLAGQSPRVLVANDVWPTAPPIASLPARRASVLTPRVVGHAASAPPGTAIGADQVSDASYLADDGTARYASAIDLLRAGKYDEAASAFHAFEARPRATQAEDASFLEAVALARAGRLDAAALVAEHHLESFPQSFHRKETAILVARAASGRGDCDKARAVLVAWLDAMPEAEAKALLRTCFR
jgi:TolA-binding protein